jgi:hypothetical protein
MEHYCPPAPLARALGVPANRISGIIESVGLPNVQRAARPTHPA